MLQLKRFTAADGEQAYTFLQAFAPDENGFMNPYRGCPKDQFLTQDVYKRQDNNAARIPR